MTNDDFDSELFDGAIELQQHERGASFGLSPLCYFRMARMANDAAAMGIEPALICRLPNDERGVKVVLFGSKYQFTLCVRACRSCTTLAIVAEPLDGHHPLHCRIPVFEGEDSDRSWSRGLRAMLEFEGVAFYDSYWAEEQQGEGDDGVEAA
jgi:hypothetical protein